MQRRRVLGPVTILLSSLLIVFIMLSSSLPNSFRRGEVRSLDSLVYPSNATTIELTGCRVLVNDTKPMPRTTIRTIAITVLINGTAVGTTTILSRQANTLGDVHERTYRLLPIVEYSCGGKLHAIEFTKLRHVNVSKISLMIIEYMAPAPSKGIKCFSNEGDDIYVELVNGSKKPMKKTLLYTVLIEHGGYIILEKR